MTGISGMRCVLVVAAMLLAGCSDGGDPAQPGPATNSDAATDSSESPVETPAADEQMSQREVDNFLRSLVDGFDYTYTMVLDGARLIRTEGTWHAPNRWVSRSEMQMPGEEPAVMNNVSVGTEQWMQMEGWPEEQRGCWLAMTPTQVPVGLQFLQPSIPGPVRTLDALRSNPDGYAVRFAYAAQLLTAQTTAATGLDAHMMSKAKVPVSVEFSGDRINSITVQARDILEVVPAEPGTAPEVLDLVEGIEVELTFAESRTSEAERPPRETIVQADDVTTCH